MPAPGQEAIEGMVKSCNDPPSEEGLMKSNLKWIKEEAVLKRLAFMQMDSRAIEDLFDVSTDGKPCPSGLAALASSSPDIREGRNTLTS